MRAIYFEKYGAPQEALELRKMSKPVPQAGEVLVKVKAASINAANWRTVQSKPFLLVFLRDYSHRAIKSLEEILLG